MPLTDQQIQVACDWWAQAISAPRFDNGDRSFAGAMGQMLAQRLTTSVTPEQITKFKAALAVGVRENQWPSGFSIRVDYDPDEVLAEAMHEAGISHNNAPWKTSMQLFRGGVQVRAGYAANPKVLLEFTEPAPEDPLA
jgi:hypothetical protein